MLFRSVHVDVDLDEFDDRDLIDELESRGYIVAKRDSNRVIDVNDLDRLYKEFLSGEDMFNAYVKRLLIDNGYHP